MDQLNLNSNTNRLNVEIASKHSADSITEYRYEYSFNPSVSGNFSLIPQLTLPDSPFIHLHTRADGRGIVGRWQPDSHLCKQLSGDWGTFSEINLSHSAPVICLFDGSDRNVLTVSVSEVSRDIRLLAGVHEETGEINLHIIVCLAEPVVPGTLTVRLDFRQLPFDTVLKDVASWWDTILPDSPMNVPSCARLPMYSTWYSYHQDMYDETMLEEYRKAAQMGMKAVIIDDGWQTADNNRGYGYCGDWQPEPGKFPDFARHVEEIHRLGMKCILWYSVPFMGEYSKMWDSFRHMLLHYDPVLHTGILDPRYPQVRRYLVSVYHEACKNWHLDGFKLDFIDSFRSYPDTPGWNDEMDFYEIQEAVYCLMIEIRRTLTLDQPDLLIEFRQQYIGPQMRRFGNMFRVNDCPLSLISNRVAITDLRLLSGSTAVHSDMVMWSPSETPENVAVQLISCIFATMQISVKLGTLTSEQAQALEHYLRFATDYREVLLTGDFSARNPLGQYPSLCACKNEICIQALYDARQVAEFPDQPLKEYWLLNGTTCGSVFLKTAAVHTGSLTVFDCFGNVTSHESSAEFTGISEIPVPSGGSLRFEPNFKK